MLDGKNFLAMWNETYKMVVASQLIALHTRQMLAREAEQESHRFMVQLSIKEFTVINCIITMVQLILSISISISIGVLKYAKSTNDI